MNLNVAFKWAILCFAFSSSMAASLRDDFGVNVDSGEGARLQDEARSRGMWDAERWVMLKSLDSDIKDIATQETQQRKSGNSAKADRLRAQLDALRARRAIYARAPD